MFLHTGGKEERWKAAKISREFAACAERCQVSKHFPLLFTFEIEYICMLDLSKVLKVNFVLV